MEFDEAAEESERVASRRREERTGAGVAPIASMITRASCWRNRWLE